MITVIYKNSLISPNLSSEDEPNVQGDDDFGLSSDYFLEQFF